MPRTHGRRGARLSNPTPELVLSRFAAPPSTPPPQGDVSHGITDWGMLGNNQEGNCGPCAEPGHHHMALTGQNTITVNGNALAADSAEATAAILNLYHLYGIAMGEPPPSPDEGVDNATWLKWLCTHDWKGNEAPAGQGIIYAYARIPIGGSWGGSTADVVHQSMLNYGGVLRGQALTDQAETEFDNHQPWQITTTEPVDPNNGHDTLLVRYDTTSTPAYEVDVTWGALQDIEISYDVGEELGRYLEFWVTMSEETADVNGIDKTALLQAITNWGGSVFTPSVPTPEPSPLSRLLVEIEADIQKLLQKIHGAGGKE